jgi:phosphoribosyl 1,2-cyclic phosphodiesterase
MEVKLTFLGTRGYVEVRTPLHRMQSSMAVSYNGKSVIVDCGADWLGKVEEWDAEAIVVTHAHPDHADGLKTGAPCPVYATKEAWEVMNAFDVRHRRLVTPREPTEIAGIGFEAFPVAHSSRAPAVGYRIAAGQVSIFYVPDVVWIRDREGAMSGAKLYVGDGATVTRSMIRKIGDALIGHVPVRTQLTWCQKTGVSRAIFTHCGAEIVEADARTIQAKLQALAKERKVEAQIAYDGLEVVLR